MRTRQIACLASTFRFSWNGRACLNERMSLVPWSTPECGLSAFGQFAPMAVITERSRPS